MQMVKATSRKNYSQTPQAIGALPADAKGLRLHQARHFRPEDLCQAPMTPEIPRIPQSTCKPRAFQTFNADPSPRLQTEKVVALGLLAPGAREREGPLLASRKSEGFGGALHALRAGPNACPSPSGNANGSTVRFIQEASGSKRLMSVGQSDWSNRLCQQTLGAGPETVPSMKLCLLLRARSASPFQTHKQCNSCLHG